MTVEQIESYLATINFPCNLNRLPDSAYLVGGSVRDALLKRFKTFLDLDFILPTEAIATARQIANLYDGGFVILDETREIARVVFAKGTLDLARQEGSSLETDLTRRDFTINAIAYNLQSRQLVDPLGGLEDLQRGIIRAVSVKNLEDDPLRLLRAYRQAAQLDFTIEAETRTAIRDRTSLLETIAAERVQAELKYIFTTPQRNKWLAAAIEDGLLKFWLPNAEAKLEQLDAVAKGIDFCLQSGLKMPELSILTFLSALVAIEPETAEAELIQLKYSRAQIKAVTKTVKHLPQLQQLKSQMSLQEQYFWFLEVKDVFPILIARAIATGVSVAILTPLIQRYLDLRDPIVYPQCLVTGNDLIRELNLKPSPIIGELLTKIQVAQIESKIFTPQQAIEFAKSILENSTDESR
jgi:tRNA nucleotidyltransferase (CCA-adding enzyme)